MNRGERAAEKPKRDPPTKTLIKELVPTDSRQKATHTKLDIIDLRPLMRGFTVECIILDVLSSRNTNSGMVFSFLVADTTAVCTLVVWQYGECLHPGDMLRITNGEVRIYDGKMEICASKRDGTIRRYDENVMKFVETEEPNLSKFLWCEAPSSPLDIIPVQQQGSQLEEVQLPSTAKSIDINYYYSPSNIQGSHSDKRHRPQRPIPYSRPNSRRNSEWDRDRRDGSRDRDRERDRDRSTRDIGRENGKDDEKDGGKDVGRDNFEPINYKLN